MLPTVLRLSARGPVEGVTENDEADHGVARRLGKNRNFAGSVGIESAGGSGFGGVVYREAGPQAVCFVAQVQRVANQRKCKKRNRAEGKNGGDGIGRVFIVGVDGRLGGNDGGDSANRGADREKRSELGIEFEGAAENMHESKREGDRDGDEQDGDAAEME